MGFLIENWKEITGFIGVFGSFAAGYKARKMNLKGKEVGALQNIQAAYDTLTKKVKDDIIGLTKEISGLKKENLEQRATMRELQKDNSKLNLQVTQLTTKNGELKQLVTLLSGENKVLHGKLEKYK